MYLTVWSSDEDVMIFNSFAYLEKIFLFDRKRPWNKWNESALSVNVFYKTK